MSSIDVATSDIKVPDLSLGSIRAWSVYFIISRNADVLKGSGDSRIKDLQALRQSIIGLEALFSAHHSQMYLDKVDKIEGELKILWGKISDMETGQEYAKKLMEWFGLIARYLLPNEGISESREGGINFSVFANETFTREDVSFIKIIEKTKDVWVKQFISKGEFEDRGDVKYGK